MAHPKEAVAVCWEALAGNELHMLHRLLSTLKLLLAPKPLQVAVLV
jgi:hypothetical protein